MKLRIAMIRHGQIRAEAGRLIGVTDEPLTEGGIQLIRLRKETGTYPEASLVFSSGLARCVETAGIIYPATPIVILKELRAPDYGDFEGKSHAELLGSEAFAKWAGASRSAECPNGEGPYAMASRSAAGFRKIADEMAGKGLESVSMITHRLVMQFILERYHIPRAIYTDWDVEPGCGYILSYDTILSSVKIEDKI